MIYTRQQIEIMRQGGKILAKIVKEVAFEARAGIATKELDSLAEGLIFKYGAKPAFRDYNNFPAALCVSINEEVVHGIPSSRVLKEGDIVSLDLGILYKGFYADMAVTLGVGKIDPEAARLIRITKKTLKIGIKKIKPGNTVGDIGNTIQRWVESQGFNVVRELVGHGIGKSLHESPQIPNYGKRHKGEELKEGMVLCLEPMVTAGDWHVKEKEKNGAWATTDNKLSAHFEHTIAVIKNGHLIITK